MSEVALSSDFLGAFGLLERDGSILMAANRRALRPECAPVRVFDLPGGRVEPGETLREALVREWIEECRVRVEPGEFLFLQEGVRIVDGRRRYAWRSFFFRVETEAEPTPGAEIEGLLWVPRSRVADVLDAPYHAGFVRWLTTGDPFQRDTWEG